MPIGPLHLLSLLTFPQSWDGTSLVVRFLCLPKGDPLGPLRPDLPSFASANLVFDAKLISSLDRLPLPVDAVTMGPLALNEPPVQKADLFTELSRQFTIVPRGLARPQAQFRKVLTESYRQLIGDRQHSPLLADAAEFGCALHQGATDQPPAPIDLPPGISWGQLMAHALRQPKLAAALGLMGQATITPVDPQFFALGGWLYIDLNAGSDYAGAEDILARYAARIPKLTDRRAIFAAVLFPVLDAPADFVADDVAREAQTYDDGLAKLVHCAQNTDNNGDTIQLAWDDEQIAEWFHRQVQLTPGRELKVDAPNGISGYRVDVREAGDEAWKSLLRIESIGDLQLGPFSLGAFQGEGVVEVAPAQISPKQDGMFWLPSYFATWRGSSLALTDSDLTTLHARPEVQNPDPDAPQHLLNKEKVFAPVDDKAVPLEYGKTYEFRVRLSDLSRGGPDASVPVPDPPHNTVASITFHRRKAPGQIEILERPQPDSRRVRIAKPRLGYPEALFTGLATFADLALDLDRMAADPKLTREISVPDPDVLTVEIQVQVKALAGDTGAYLPLYRTTRTFDTPEMLLELQFQDHATLTTLLEKQPDSGPLVLPSARDLRLTFVGIGRDQPGYFADETTRQGTPVNMDLRADASLEADFLGEPEGFSSLRSFFFQPPPPDNTVASPAERLAAEIGLDHAALTLSGRVGKRTVVACSANLRHTLTPESSAITFASATDLQQRWINVVKFDALRDWTWDGLEGDGIEVTRTVHIAGNDDAVETVGSFRLPRVLNPNSIVGNLDPRGLIRRSTELIFFDAFDPKPRPVPAVLPELEKPSFPSEIMLEYAIKIAIKGLLPGQEVARSILLPVTTPPSQTPRLVSAGIALSEYKAASDYSSTEARRRMLWFEFEAPPADPEDAYFVRVLAKAPDPMLLETDLDLAESFETPLPIDPEWMRLITPGQPRDEAGLAAMQQNGDPAAGSSQYLIPLPPDIQSSSPELLGFFVYEVRVGHTSSRWSTAQGRYGPMLRISGVQHPAPPLVCQAARSETGVQIQAPFATPVFNGANFRPLVPQTDLWALLYARVRQADGLASRNVVLAQTQLFAPHAGNDPERAGLPILYGEGSFAIDSITSALSRLGLPEDEPLTTLVCELFQEPPEDNPLGSRLGQARMLRISTLVPVPDAC